MDIKTLQRLIQAQNLYVLQDTTAVVGDAALFHREDHRGYTTNLAEAHLFTLKEANLCHFERKTDKPHRLGDLIVLSGLSVDVGVLGGSQAQNSRDFESIRFVDNDDEPERPGPR
ncbi:hypothetical protein [Marinobacter nauticus]|nr:hypothetical protein [Marinobacter nauticus]